MSSTWGSAARLVQALLATHVEKLRLFDTMRSAHPNALLRLAREFDNLEFRQQGLWGFALDRDHHRWFDVPRCSCPKHGNSQLLSMPVRLVADACEVHGQLLHGRHSPEPYACGMCPSEMPVGDDAGSIISWKPLTRDSGIRVVNVDCPEHGPGLLSFTPPG